MQANNVLQQVTCYAPALGSRFVAQAKVARAGKRQVTSTAELYSQAGGKEKLVACGSAVLMVT